MARIGSETPFSSEAFDLNSLRNTITGLPDRLARQIDTAYRQRTAELRHLIGHFARVELIFWEGGGTPVVESDRRARQRLEAYATAARSTNPIAAATNFAASTWFWSSAFVSYVLERAGVRPEEFAFAMAHHTYIRRAHENRATRQVLVPYWLCTLEEVAPEVGDILCSNRGGGALTYTPSRRGGGLPGSFESHTDVVTGVSVNLRGNPVLVTTGGNVGNTVTRRFVPVDANFRVTATSHRGVEPRNRRPGRYFAVVRLRSAVTEVYP
jgi:hypothetical protein